MTLFRGVAIHLAFFLSGMSGLIYQIIWVRQFGISFGNTVYSAGLVSGIFVLGLGVGGYLAGSLSDRLYAKDVRSSLKLYSIAEVGIAVWGLLIAFVLPELENLAASFSSYKAAANGWLEISFFSKFLKYIFAIFLTLPSSILMGATLTFLMRYFIRANEGLAGWGSGLLFGINTFGAAVGCFGVDFFWVPHFGVFETQFLAVVLNLAAASLVGVIYLGIEPEKAFISQAKLNLTPRLKLVLAIVFFTGLTGMGMEILWFRNLTSSLGSFRAVFSLLLFTILVGIWFGSFTAGYLSRKFKNPTLLFIISQLCFIASTIACLLFFDVQTLSVESSKGLSAFGSKSFFSMAFWILSYPILNLVAVPSFFMGFAFPLANAIAQESKESVGQTAGFIYLWNTLGGVCGSVLAAFVLLPLFGMKGCAVFLMTFALIPLYLLLKQGGLAKRSALLRRAMILPGLLAIVALGWFFVLIKLNPNFFVFKSFRSFKDIRATLEPANVVWIEEGLKESIVILELPGPSKGRRERRFRYLYTNGHPMSSNSPGSQRYMRSFVHLPLMHLDRPRDVLVICFGVGNTAHAATLHESVTNIELVDLSKDVLRQAHHFKRSNENVLENSRVNVFVNDGRLHLKMKGYGPYDLVTLEPPPIQFAGVSALYSIEFYRKAKEKLKKGGFITQWFPLNQLPPLALMGMLKSFLEVFPNAVFFQSDRANFIMMGRKDDKIQLDVSRLTKIFENSKSPLAQDLNMIGIGKVSDVLDMYRSSGSAMMKVLEGVEGVVSVSDNHPVMEYGRLLYRKKKAGLPREFLARSGIEEWTN